MSENLKFKNSFSSSYFAISPKPQTKFIDPIIEMKFKGLDFEIIKLDHSIEIRGLGQSFPKNDIILQMKQL